MPASRAGDCYSTPAARNAQTRSAFGAFEIFVLFVGKSVEKGSQRLAKIAKPNAKTQKPLVFGVARVPVLRKEA